MTQDRIGRLNRRITIRVPGHGQDSTYGGGTRTYLTSDAIWAGVEYKQAGSDEREIGDQYSARQVTNFTIRNRSGLNTGMEVVYESLIYRVEAIQPGIDRAYAILECLQIGEMRHSSLIDATGAILADENDIILVWMPGEADEGYETPELTFS